MPLTNTQYDEIMRGYQATQLKNKRITDARMRQARQMEPRIREIEDAIASVSVASARRLLDGDQTVRNSLRQQLAALRAEKEKLLSALDFPPAYFEPVYTCPDCKDTGYIGGEKCHCFKQAVIDVVYSQSHIKEVLQRENFSTFDYRYFSDTVINPATGLSSLQTMKKAVSVSRNFIEDFERKPKNMLLYGDTGVGKTFLTNCIAAELLNRGYSVIYLTAFELFDILSKGVFDRDADAIAAHQSIFDSDLLIIDDLGTELSNSFTSSQLFLCVNERLLRQKSTIISTNLGLNQLMDTYSERTFSRITSNYATMKLFGTDIRLQKRTH